MEVRFHIAVLSLAALAIFVVLAVDAGTAIEVLWRQALFQTTSILTCTGFGTADFELWPPFTQMLLLVLMYIGGNTGSTSGGIKSFRIVLLFGILRRNFRQMIERRGVFAVRIAGQVIPENTIRAVMSLVLFVFLFNFAAVFLLAASGVDLLTSLSAVEWLNSIVRPVRYSLVPPFPHIAAFLRESQTGESSSVFLQFAVDTLTGLTAVDGAAVISDYFEPLAFGVKIVVPDSSHRVDQVLLTEPIEGVSDIQIDPSQLGGARHLSAAQFAYAQRDALALVASQDGRFTVFAWSSAHQMVHAYRLETLLI